MKSIKIPIIILLLGILVLPLWAGNYQKTILALYKSTENQTDKENEIFWYLSIPLKNMGFQLKFWDMDKGIPKASLLAECRAIVTWFRGQSMPNPEGYMDMLDNFIDSGKKVIVIDNFGAYSNTKTGVYVDMGRLNLTFARLGIIYLGDWTQDSAILKFETKESPMVEYQAKQNLKESAFFYHFAPVDRDLQVYLSVRRTDRSYAASPVILSNSNGGFALTRYIYRMENNKLKLLLNVEKFLKKTLFPSSPTIKIGILADSSESCTASILSYTKAVLKRVKLPCEVILKDQIPNLVPGDLRKFTAVGIILKDDAGIKGDVINEYLKEGGGLVSLFGGAFYTFAPYLSLTVPDKRQKFQFEQKGYNFGYGFLLGEGLTIEDKEFKSLIGYATAAKGVEILGYDYSKQVPLAWYAEKEGNGKVVTWNWDAFGLGEFQGFILESFLKVMPVGVAGTPGLAIMFIDDWPLPMYNAVKSPLKIDDTQFYTEVWWPDMKSLLDKNNIDYTSFLVFNYNGKMDPPFTSSEFFVGRDMATTRMARDILSSNKELGFHGYNHNSLTREKTVQNPHAWNSLEHIYMALETAKRNWIGLFGEHNLPLSYVAPHNIISEEGIQALHDVFPSIQVISTLRSGDGDESHYEFGSYEKIPEIYMIPRTLSGYVFRSEHRQLMIGGITGPGIWAHFIHPDDIFDPARSFGYNWPQLKTDFQKMINYANNHYPWLRYMNSVDAYRELAAYDESGAEFRWEGNTLKVNSVKNIQFRIRINAYNPKAIKMQGLKVVYAYKRMDAMILETTEPTAEITFLRKNR